MKLNEEAPEQHLAIMVIAGLFILLNLIYALRDTKKGNTADSGAPNAPGVVVVDEHSGESFLQTTLHYNPTLSWTERIFCRGLRRSSWCSYKELHPLLLEDNNGDNKGQNPAGTNAYPTEPTQKNVINYRGPLERSSIFSRRTSIPAEDLTEQYNGLKQSLVEQ